MVLSLEKDSDRAELKSRGGSLVVPIEEFAFYILGCAFLVLTYIWASEHWYPAHTMPEGAFELCAPTRSSVI